MPVNAKLVSGIVLALAMIGPAVYFTARVANPKASDSLSDKGDLMTPVLQTHGAAGTTAPGEKDDVLKEVALKNTKKRVGSKPKTSSELNVVHDPPEDGGKDS